MTQPNLDLLRVWTRPAARFLKNRRGNVAIIAAFTTMVLCFIVGMGVDYTLKQRRLEQINGYADAAALSAVTPNAMTQSWNTSSGAALTMFKSQIATVTNITYSNANLTVTGGDVTQGTVVTRTAIITWSANSTNAFASLLGIATLPINGSATATSTDSPNTNFYLLLDDSPSMGIAATTGGINTMVSNTGSQGGCAFGCHEANPSGDGLGNPGGEDNLALARNLGVTLRIDLVNFATQNLMSVAQTTATNNNTTYKVAIYTMDTGLNLLWPSSPGTPSSNFVAAQTAAANIQQQEVYQNNQACANVACTSGVGNNDENSYLDTALGGINTAMPAPGNGTNNVGDTPQEVLMIVSDGVNDYQYSGGRNYAPISTNNNWCSTIKARGIRIAYLYLTYSPLPTNSWYTTYIRPYQNPTDQYATAGQNCASAGLYYQVSTDGDVSGALQTLFEKAVATARLVH